MPDGEATAAGPSAAGPTLVGADGAVTKGVARDELERRLASGEFFWLDLPNPGEEGLGWLRDVLSFHPLAVEDSEHFQQRPKLEEYDKYIFLVLYGSAAPGSEWTGPLDTEAPYCSPDTLESLSEVHCFVSDKYVVTVHRDDCPAFGDLAKRMQAHGQVHDTPARVFYRVADTLVDSFFPVLSDLDDLIDSLQAQVIRRPTNEQLAQLLKYKSSLIALRRVITPQRDVFASLAGGVTELPGDDAEAQRYFRDIYDHLIRLSDLVDSYRDLLSGTMDAYLSVVSNQLNQVMKQLTIIATVFLPLSFLTGFFGQNFTWLVSHLTSLGVFLLFGIGTEVLAVGLLFWLFWSRGWMGQKQ